MVVKRKTKKHLNSRPKSKSKASLSIGGRGPSRKPKHSKVAKLIRLAKARVRNNAGRKNHKK